MLFQDPARNLADHLLTYPKIQMLMSLREQYDFNVFVYGGVVREYLQGVTEFNDIDICIECEEETSSRVTHTFANLCEEYGWARDHVVVDITVSETIQNKWYQCDLSINSIMLDMQKKEFLENIGLEDLKNGIIRINSPLNFITSPSFIRLFYVAIKYDYDIDSESLEFIKKYLPMAKIFHSEGNSKNIHELMRIFNFPMLGKNFDLMAEIGYFQTAFPELFPLQSQHRQAKQALSYLDFNFRLIKTSEKLLEHLPSSFKNDLVDEDSGSTIIRFISVTHRKVTTPVTILAKVRLTCLFYQAAEAYTSLDKKLPEMFYTEDYKAFLNGKIMECTQERLGGMSNLSEFIVGVADICDLTQQLNKALKLSEWENTLVKFEAKHRYFEYYPVVVFMSLLVWITEFESGITSGALSPQEFEVKKEALITLGTKSAEMLEVGPAKAYSATPGWPKIGPAKAPGS